jgi:hypothetical protein
MDQARAITDSLIKHHFASLFLILVNPIRDDAPDYRTMIVNPMDLQTVSRKLNENAYPNWQAWAADVDLIFDNCMTYNSNSIEGDVAQHMKTRFHKLLVPLKRQTYEGWIEESQSLYQRIGMCMKNSPSVVHKFLSVGIEDDMGNTFSESYLQDLALSLSMLRGPDLVPVLEILKMFGHDFWGVKGRKAELNLKTLPQTAIRALADYIEEGEEAE